MDPTHEKLRRMFADFIDDDDDGVSEGDSRGSAAHPPPPKKVAVDHSHPTSPIKGGGNKPATTAVSKATAPTTTSQREEGQSVEKKARPTSASASPSSKKKSGASSNTQDASRCDVTKKANKATAKGKKGAAKKSPPNSPNVPNSASDKKGASEPSTKSSASRKRNSGPALPQPPAEAVNAPAVGQQQSFRDWKQLQPELIAVLEKRSISRPTLFQKRVFDHIMGGGDTIAISPDGNNKTISYVLPVASQLLKDTSVISNNAKRLNLPMVLCIVPSHEVGEDIAAEFNACSLGKLAITTMCGDGLMSEQCRKLHRGVHVVVGTPGRLMDLECRLVLTVAPVKYVIIDETEKLNEKHQEAIRILLSKIVLPHQVLVFTQSMTPFIQSLRQSFMSSTCETFEPPVTAVQSKQTNQQLALFCPNEHTAVIVPHLIKAYSKNRKTILYCNRKEEANELLSGVPGCRVVHFDITADERKNVLDSFRQGAFATLITTDSSGRGIDFNNVGLVILTRPSFEFTQFLCNATKIGRFSSKGVAITIFSRTGFSLLRRISIEQGVQYKRIAAPTGTALLDVQQEILLGKLNSVSESDTSCCMDLATSLLKQHGEQIFAKTLAVLAGLSNSQPISLLATHPGYTTIRIELERPLLKTDLNNVLSQYIHKPVQLGLVHVWDNNKTIFADVLHSDALGLTRNPVTPGGDVVSIEIAKSLPEFYQTIESVNFRPDGSNPSWRDVVNDMPQSTSTSAPTRNPRFDPNDE